MANQYILVQNKTTVLLGPMFWRQRFLQSEITDLVDAGELSSSFPIPPAEQGYISIGEGFEIFPVDLEIPTYDKNFEFLSGPFYTYANNVATGTYTVNQLDLASIQNNLKAVAASMRYSKEIAGTTYIVSSGQTINISTDRQTRIETITNINTILLTLSANSTVSYKTSAGFLQLTSADLTGILNTTTNYVQTQFDWEKSIDSQITAATDIQTLQTIYTTSLTPPAPAVPNIPKVGQ